MPEQTTLALGCPDASLASYQVAVRVLSRVQEEPAPLTRPQDAADYWHAHLATGDWFDPEKEHLVVLLLDTKLKIKAWSLVSVGSLNESIAHPREIFRAAVAAAAYGVVVMHNHPSGQTEPSHADRRLTSRLEECGRILDIHVLDHVIVGSRPAQPCFSFKDEARGAGAHSLAAPTAPVPTVTATAPLPPARRRKPGAAGRGHAKAAAAFTLA